MEFESGEELHFDVGARRVRVVKYVKKAISRFAISSSSAQMGLQQTEPAAIILDQGIEDIVPLSKLSKLTTAKNIGESIMVP